MKKILIATTNIGKFQEFTAQFEDIPFCFVNLKQARLDKDETDEPFETTWENAARKAKYYAQKSGLLTIAEDTAFFVDYLNGEPGIKAKRFGKNAFERNKKIINLLKGALKNERGAYFETGGCVYDPTNESFNVFIGKARGVIAEKEIISAREGMGYDSIFYYPPMKKCFAELSIADKNHVSHRGKVIHQIKLFLMNHYAAKQIIAPAAIIIKDGKALLCQRRDCRPAFDGKWEFPGGGVDYGEETKECLLREVREETGYKIKILEQLPEIFTSVCGEKLGNYQVFLVLFICKIKSGTFKSSDIEIRSHVWRNYKEMILEDLMPLNKKMLLDKNNMKVIKKYIK